ncbi:MAG: DUF1576 domain-containing protein [Lachnospiraceae bacterium]|nr:DUF1576 domain-containing protein [Lachnospiraceae bacterium]
MKKIKGNELKIFSIVSIVLLVIAAFVCDSPKDIVLGIRKIVISRDALITDYFELAGTGAAFMNAAIVSGICLVLVLVQKIPFTGPTLAALFINAGYALWGKNPVNILPVLLGTYVYAKVHRAHFGRYIYTALFGTCLAPLVTEILYLLPIEAPLNFVIVILVGILIGFLLPPLSAHTASMHMGYNLFNVGFSAGILAFVMVCVFRSFGLECEPVFIWQEGRSIGLVICLYLYFSAAIIIGFLMNEGNFKRLLHIFKHSGRAVADYVLMDGPGATLMNMGLVGILTTTYIVLIGGDFSGPVVGAIWMAFGFASFGAHIKSYFPVLLGVYLFTFISKYEPTEPGIQLAAIFAVGISPIAGQFGPFAGILAGMLHSAIVMCTSTMYGGLNLYNNGFSAGWVAVFLVPPLESFIKHIEDSRHRRGKMATHKKNGKKEV